MANTSLSGVPLGAALWSQFPVLYQQVHGKRLVYLDNAATAQRPACVVTATDEFYTHDNASVHRGVHALSQRATEQFEGTRQIVAQFLNAAESAEIIFTKGCTEAINLVSSSWGRANLGSGDVVLVSEMEHHANIVTWQIAAEITGCTVVKIPVTDDADIDMDAYRALLTPQVKMVAVKHVCNAIGTINPVEEMIPLAHAVGAKVIVDGAQSLAHLNVDVRALDADFYTMSGHKVYGPTGVGVLYGKRALLESMPPFQGGGGMIRDVSFQGTTYAEIPDKFEPGTPNIAGVIGLGKALEWVKSVGLENIAEHENRLAQSARERLWEMDGVNTIGKPRKQAGIISFTMRGVHPHDIGTILDQHGVAIRTGMHCCHPLLDRLGQGSTARASFAAYNIDEDVDIFVSAVRAAQEMFA